MSSNGGAFIKFCFNDILGSGPYLAMTILLSWEAIYKLSMGVSKMLAQH